MKIFSYTPTVKECWIMFLCVLIPGSILSFPTTFVKDIHFISTFLSYILTLSPAFLYAHLKGKAGNGNPSNKINNPYFGKLNSILLFLLLPFVFLSYLIVSEPITTIITTPEWFEEMMKEMALGGNLYWSVITTCICAPVLEELLCRGIMLRGIIENSKSPAKGIFWSSLIFGVLHMNPWQAIPAFVMGLLFGWLYYRTRCIWVPIVLHIFNNSLSTAILKIYPDLPPSITFRELIGDPQLYFSIFALSIAVLALTYFIITKFVGKLDEQEHKTIISV